MERYRQNKDDAMTESCPSSELVVIILLGPRLGLTPPDLYKVILIKSKNSKLENHLSSLCLNTR